MPGTKQRMIKRPKRFPRGKRRKKDPASPIRSAATSFTASLITDFRHNKETASARKLSKSPFWNIVSEFDSSISDLHGSSSGDELRDSSDSADSDGENGMLLLDKRSLQSALESVVACTKCSGPLSLREDPGVKQGLYNRRVLKARDLKRLQSSQYKATGTAKVPRRKARRRPCLTGVNDRKESCTHQDCSIQLCLVLAHHRKISETKIDRVISHYDSILCFHLLGPSNLHSNFDLFLLFPFFFH